MKQMSIEEWLLEKSGKGWKLIEYGSFIAWNDGGKNMPLCRTAHENRIMDEPDVICEGAINGAPAYIGFKEWVSGWNDQFHEYEAIQYKLKEK